DSSIDHYSLRVIAIGSTFGMLSNESGDDYYVTSDVSQTIQITQSPTPIMSYETYDFTKNDGTVEQRFAGRIHWNFANSTQTSNINFYKVFVKASNPQNSVLFGYDISEAQVDPNYPDYNFYIVRDRRFANVTYIDTYEFFVIACQDENGFDSAPSSSLADLSYNLFASGQNGSTIPFQITTELHFSAMKYNLDASYVLTKNMTLTSVPESIGTTDMPFFGTFDGAGYTISGTNGALVINSRNTTFKGLFGVIGEGGIVKNVTFNATINATTGRTENLIQIAAIAITNNGRIEDVVVQGTVSSEYNLEAAKVYNAGVAVYNYGTITRVASKAIINPKNTRNDVYAGGISIFNYGTIEKSGFVGQAYGQVVGGITAQNLGGKIEQCYYEENAALSTAIITSNKGLSINMAGGIAGYMTSGSISYCYSTARVSGSTNTIPVYIGGMVGYISGGKIQKSYVVAVNPSGASIITATGSTLNATKAGVFVGVSDSTTPVSGSGLICRRASGQAFIGSGTFSAQEVASIQSSLDNADLNDHGYFDTSTTNPSLRNAKY
ncbi:MAG: hypothetical protein J6T39_01090, partial [Clostridia bacterium]|nr:hypothetical protein [Clostridia bacterium]